MSAIAVQPHRSAATQDPEEVATRLFAEHSEQVFGYCLHQLRSRAEAEDATQTTFLYALRALRQGVIPDCESAWLTTIARNVCHSERRTVDRRGSLAPEVELDTIALAQTGDDEEELLMGFRDALAAMPENQRRALVLREWQGVPAREIASELGLSATATHALLTRARHSFAQALTAARQPALGLVWLLVELRSHLKTLLGGVSTKAAVTSIAVVGVGVGGVAMDRSLADSNSPTAPARYAEQSGSPSEARPPVAHATPPSSAAQGLQASSSKTSDPSGVSTARAVRRPDAVPTPSAPPAALSEKAPEPAAETSPLAPEPPVKPLVNQPQLPEMELPTQVVPPLPTVEVPPLPTVEAPLPPTVEVPPLPEVGAPPVPVVPLPSDVPPLPAVPLP